jgi:tyrosyl-tRNA synthetase
VEKFLPLTGQGERTTMASTAMTPQEKFNLIVRNLEEHYGDEFMLNILEERDLKLYWGTAPTGSPHCCMSLSALKLTLPQDTLSP